MHVSEYATSAAWHFVAEVVGLKKQVLHLLRIQTFYESKRFVAATLQYLHRIPLQTSWLSCCPWMAVASSQDDATTRVDQTICWRHASFFILEYCCAAITALWKEKLRWVW
jgi:hypothetical protein